MATEVRSLENVCSVGRDSVDTNKLESVLRNGAIPDLWLDQDLDRGGELCKSC
jgi:hypothetical protein